MGKPAKIDPCGIQLVHEPSGITFTAFVEVKRNHAIENGAIVKIRKNSVCISGRLHNYEWTSRPIQLANDLVEGSKSNRFFIRLTMTLSIRDTGVACREETLVPPGPGSVTVTITNAPGTINEQPGDEEEADPIYFP